MARIPMWEGQDFDHRIGLYQRYPTGFTGGNGNRNPSLIVVSFCCYQRYSANISTWMVGREP